MTLLRKDGQIDGRTFGRGLQAAIVRNPSHQSKAGRNGGAATGARFRDGTHPSCIRRAEKARHRYQTVVLARYGLALEDIAQLWNRQNGACPLCLEALPQNGFVIDHDHATGIVRGLLHQWCNRPALPIIERFGECGLVYAAITPVDLYLAENGAR
jgi:recombination endonuclease VII